MDTWGIIVAGPPGAGKSTLAVALAKQGWLRPSFPYIEQRDRNPFLRGRVYRVALRQRWFLQQYEDWLAELSSGCSLIIDQDPRAVVAVYSKLFNDQGLISDREYQRQLDRCRRIIARLYDRAKTWRIVWLRAPRTVLVRRLSQRQFASPIHGRTLTTLFDHFDAFATQLKAKHDGQWLEFDTRMPTTKIIPLLRSALAKSTR